jgi:2-dehydro-3-deoxygluconokinase
VSESAGPRRDVTSIGEAQLRLNSAAGKTLEETPSLDVHVAGTEGNVLGLLSRMGNSAGLITALPSGPLGRRMAAEYLAAGVDLSAVRWRESGRVALYFAEQFSAPIPGRVIYDRQHSCFAEMVADDVDWDYLTDARLVHLTGITDALNPGTHEIVCQAVDRAKRAGCRVAFDVNHRVGLSSVQQAQERLAALIPRIDVLFCSRRDASCLFGIEGDARQVAEALRTRFGVSTILVSDGSRSVAAMVDGTVWQASPPETVIVDRIGAGDALVGGFLHGYLAGQSEWGLRLGVAAAALSLATHGDQVRTSADELDRLSRSLGADIVR